MARELKPEQFEVIHDGQRIPDKAVMALSKFGESAKITVYDNGTLEIFQQTPWNGSYFHRGEWIELEA